MLTDGIEELKERESTEACEDELISDCYSWDKGDCSKIGLIAIVFKFMLANELLDEHTYKDANKIRSLFDALDKGLE